MKALWLQLGNASRWMFICMALGLCCVLLYGCDGCSYDIDGTWVVCDDNHKAKLLRYNTQGKVIDTTSDLGFDPDEWDCSNAGSPPQPKGDQGVYNTGTNTGPTHKAHLQNGHAGASNPAAFLPQRLLVLPFLPPVPAPLSPSPCERSFPDVISVNHPLGLVTRISTCPFQVKLTIPVVSRPLQVEITPDGATAIVTSFDNAINFIDLASNKVTFTLNTNSSINPNGIAISPDGTRAYITSFNNTNPAVLVMDLETRTVIKSIPVDTYPLGAFLKPDGSELWVTFPFGQAVYVIDTLSGTLSTLLPIPVTTGIAFNSTGTTAYITSASGPPGAVVAVDTSTYKVARSYPVGLGPTDVAMLYGDRVLVVNNNSSGSVSAIDLSTGTVTTTAVGNGPKGVVVVK